MIFHILLSDGPKPTPRDHPRSIPAAANQLAGIDAQFTTMPNKVFVVDFVRKPIKGLASLPNLKRAIDGTRALNEPRIVVDLSRLFARCSLQHRNQLMTDLLTYGEYVVCRSYKARLSDLTQAMLHAIVLNVPPKQAARKQASPTASADRRHQTVLARSASITARQARRAADAAILAGIRDDLAGRFPKVTGRMIAQEAAHRGLHTSRGKNWRPDTVLRTLARYDQEFHLE